MQKQGRQNHADTRCKKAPLHTELCADPGRGNHRRKRPTVAFEEHHAPPTLPPARERLDDLAALRVIDTELPALPKREREAVTLCDVEGVSRDDAADSMGVTRGALRVLLHRGRTKLKEALLEAERLAGSLTGDGLTGTFAV